MSHWLSSLGGFWDDTSCLGSRLTPPQLCVFPTQAQRRQVELALSGSLWGSPLLFMTLAPCQVHWLGEPAMVPGEGILFSPSSSAVLTFLSSGKETEALSSDLPPVSQRGEGSLSGGCRVQAP